VIQRTHTEKRLLEQLRDARPSNAVLARCSDADRCTRLYQGILVRAAMTIERGATTMDVLLSEALEHVPSPERALVHLDRFLEASMSPSGILEHFLRAPRLLSDYLLLISSSLWLADTMVRDAGLFRWLLASDVLDQMPSHAAIIDAAHAALQRFERPELRRSALRRFQRRELMRIAAADLMGRKPFAAVVAELSALADAVVDCALTEAIAIIERRRGRPINARICVIALGKLGGHELNYSSDIDLMIVYDGHLPLTPSIGRTESEPLRGTGDNTPHDDTIAVVKEMLRILTESSSEGMLYRTDLRLRPDGSTGALALSRSATITYYERRGALWERQMLLRARVCAGDADLGAELFDRLEPFVYPRTMLRLPSVLLADIHSRLAERWSDDGNVKHMRGGIRHIEFSLQALQMLHAQRHPLRTPSTLSALAAFTAEHLLQPEEEALLRDAYVFLRRVEHVLQLEAFEQTHSLPTDAADLLRIAWTLGFENADKFQRRLRQTRHAVDRICGEILGTGPEKDHEDENDREALSPLPQVLADDARTRLLLHDIVEGRSSAPRSTGERQRLKAMLPELLQDVIATPLPMQALAGIEHFTHAAGATGGLSYLENTRARRLLMRLAALAPVALRELERDPLALELVFSGWEADALDDVRYQRVVAISALAALLLDDGGVDTYGQTLSAVADTILQRTIAQLHDDSFPFAVLALGKYGSEELIPGSDLDVILLYNASEVEHHERAQQLARDVIQAMQGKGAPALYEIDARLRPEGRSAPLAVTRDAWQRYLRERASLWERQSLLRARVPAGDASFAAEIMSVIESVRTQGQLSHNDVAAIRSMRLKMEPENRFRQPDFIDIKKSAGGLVDAEFAAQALQLAFPALRTGRTVDVLHQAVDLFPDIAAPVRQLSAHYLFLRRLQVFFRLLIDTPSNLFPVEEEAQLRLASAMGIEGVIELREVMRTGMFEARKNFDFILRTVSSTLSGIEP
jgi:glutamate-ammonia-ligase adenylyltransferase